MGSCQSRHLETSLPIATGTSRTTLYRRRAAGSLAAVWLIRHDPAAAVRAFLSPTMSDADLKRLTARNRASLDQAVWDRYLLNWVGPAFADDLTSYAGRVTLLAGEHDPFVTQAALAAIDDALPNSRAGAIMNAGHYPSIEAPQATCDAVEEALSLRDAQTLSR
jgi:pimeloyl-ACP methyl ester carboxylesterase